MTPVLYDDLFELLEQSKYNEIIENAYTFESNISWKVKQHADG